MFLWMRHCVVEVCAPLNALLVSDVLLDSCCVLGNVSFGVCGSLWWSLVFLVVSQSLSFHYQVCYFFPIKLCSSFGCFLPCGVNPCCWFLGCWCCGCWWCSCSCCCFLWSKQDLHFWFCVAASKNAARMMFCLICVVLWQWYYWYCRWLQCCLQCLCWFHNHFHFIISVLDIPFELTYAVFGPAVPHL